MLPPLVILGVLLSFLHACSISVTCLLGEQSRTESVVLWALPPFIGVYAATSDGATWATLPTFMADSIRSWYL